jgi:hypothetical protein
MRNREGKDFIGQETFVASASPGKQWTFPSVAEVKERILAAQRKTNAGLQRAIDSKLSEIKQEMESKVHQMEVQVLTESPR